MQLTASRSPTSLKPAGTDYACFTDDWSAIRAHKCPLVVQEREIASLETFAVQLLSLDPFMWRASGRPEQATIDLGSLPEAMMQDVAMLAERFAGLMGCGEVRLRLELADNDSCRKLHCDYTDLRLITTYSGRGTQFAEGNSKETADVWGIHAGDIALVKGWLFGEGHDPCLHRSPPIAGTGERRILLAIDTPRIDREQGE